MEVIRQISDPQFNEDVINKRYFDRNAIKSTNQTVSNIIEISGAKYDALSTNEKQNNMYLILDRDATIEGWITPTFENNWVNYGSPFSTAGYYKSNDRVYLKGLVKNGTVPSTIFTLPVGYRNGSTQIFTVFGNGLIARVDVMSTGAVYFNGGSNLWVNLDGISFRIV